MSSSSFQGFGRESGPGGPPKPQIPFGTSILSPPQSQSPPLFSPPPPTHPSLR